MNTVANEFHPASMHPVDVHAVARTGNGHRLHGRVPHHAVQAGGVGVPVRRRCRWSMPAPAVLRSRITRFVLLVPLLACDGPFVFLPAPGSLHVESGDGQLGEVGTPLADELVVRVLDDDGQPLPGIPVQFAVIAGGGRVSPQTGTSDGVGLARTRWTLGTVAGAPAVVVAKLPRLAPVAFHATARPGPPAAVRVVTGNGQSAIRGTVLPDPVVARVEDAYGNPLSGVQVRWWVLAGGGHTDSRWGWVTSGADGTVHTRWAVGFTPGENTLEAWKEGVATARFTATALPATLTLQVRPMSVVWSRSAGPSYTMVSDLQAFVTDSLGSRAISPEITWEGAWPDHSPRWGWDSVSLARITAFLRRPFPPTITAWAVFEDQRIPVVLPVVSPWSWPGAAALTRSRPPARPFPAGLLGGAFAGRQIFDSAGSDLRPAVAAGATRR